MTDIEKRARELFATELDADHRTFSARMIRAGQISLGADYSAALRAIVAALTIREGELLAGGSVNLLDQQHSGVVVAQALDVVPAAALGADEAGAVGIGGQGDQSVGIELAEVAPEHEVGVLPANDGHVTTQWQPIATAPKDGTRLMLWDSRNGGYAVTGAWVAGSADDHETITHWMPLPAAPEVSP